MLYSIFKASILGVAIMWPFTASAEPAPGSSAYDFSFKQLTGGKPLALAQFKGKVLLVVNTASKCGFTPQYKGLEALYEKYRARGFEIVGVPSNDFGSQEPGSSEKIADFCQLNYGVTFPMAAKEQVKGDGAHPFYQWARAQFGAAGTPHWNFHKYLVDRNGKLVDFFIFYTEPESPRVVNAIEALLQG